MTRAQAIQQAREALAAYRANSTRHYIDEAMEDLLATLDAETKEPVAWGMTTVKGGSIIMDCISPEEHAKYEGAYTVPLYLAPPAAVCSHKAWEAVPLRTKEESRKCADCGEWLGIFMRNTPPAAVPEGYALVKVQHEERDGFWSFSDNGENFVGEECDTELDAIAAALDYYGDDLETVYVGQAKRIDKARLVRGDHIIELIGEAAGEEVGECAYDWPRLSNDECAELERIVMGYVLSKSPAGFFTVENSREYTREEAEEMLAAADKENNND